MAEEKTKDVKECRRCGKKGRGIIQKYNLYFCRQCFREVAEKIGFERYE